MANIQMKRIYEPFEVADGFRVLVDRLWPRGVAKEAAHIDLWAKNIAPSTALRKEFHSGRDSWEQFESLYKKELVSNPDLGGFVHLISDKKKTTFLFAGKDTEHAHVKVLIGVVEEKLDDMAKG